MWLSDYKEAIEKVMAAIGNQCFMRLTWSFYGDRIMFYPSLDDNDEFYYVYNRKENTLFRIYRDTWKNPEHKDKIF